MTNFIPIKRLTLAPVYKPKQTQYESFFLVREHSWEINLSKEKTIGISIRKIDVPKIFFYSLNDEQKKRIDQNNILTFEFNGIVKSPHPTKVYECEAMYVVQCE